MHTLHRGRGRYVIIHADEKKGDDDDEEGEGDKAKAKARIETFVVGQDTQGGERLQWIVEGGKYKASFLLPDKDGEEGEDSEGLLISEVCFMSIISLKLIIPEKKKRKWIFLYVCEAY